MKTRPRSPGARLQVGDVAILSESLSTRRTSDVKETWLVTEDELDTKASPPRIPQSRPRIEPFIGQRIGHVAPVELPRGTKRFKLVGIEEMLPDEPAGDASPGEGDAALEPEAQRA